MVNRNRLNKHFSIGMTMLLTFSLITPFQPASAKANDYFSLNNTKRVIETTAVKVDPKLNKQFDQSEYVTYLVKMKEQTDTTAVSQQAMQKAYLQKATPSAAKLSARSAVVSSLRATASQTQFSIEQYLDEVMKTGEVQTYKSYFIVNALAVTSTKEVMEAIAKRSEVDKILPDETRYLQETTVTPTAERTAVSGQTPSGSAPQSGAAPGKEAGPSGGKSAAAPAGSSASAVPAVPAPGTSKPGSSSGISLGVETGKDTKTSQNSNTPTEEDANVEWNIERVNAPGVWAQGIDGTGIVVANLDTGVDYTHPALERKWRGLDASGNIVHPELSWYDAYSGNSLPNDNVGHGTHTMGTMVGSEENGTNKIGVAPGAKWIAVRIFNPDTTDSIILDGAQWLMAPVDDQGNLHPELAPDVVNNSWGGGPGLDEWFRPTVQAWRDAQIFPEFSAGNTTFTNPGGPGSVANPANYPESFATGATDINDQLADFSLQGPSPYGEVKPEVSAPGVNIRSSVPGGEYEGGWNGTSMAGPHTTAIAALLLQANHSLTVDDLENILMDTAVPRTDSTFPSTPNNGYGHGIVNALDAVGSVLQGMGSVSGKVSTGGEDTDEPVIEHTPVTFGFAGIDIPLTVHATDEVSIVGVDVYARTKGTANYVYIPGKRVSGDFKDGVYSASIPGFLVQPAGVEYYIRVNDYGNNGYDSKVYAVDISSGIKTGYTEDFEDGYVGFSTGGAGEPWQWGTPVSGPGNAASGDKVFATNLTGSYAPNSNAYLLAPPIDLTDSERGALVSFKQWYDIEENRDSGTVYLAAESTGNEFVPVNRFDGQSGGWTTQYLDLTPYAGETVSVMFNFNSDGTGEQAGWYIDDFKVVDLDDTPPAAPTGLSVDADLLGNVNLSWTAPQDEDLKQFKIYRSMGDNEHYEEIGVSQEPVYVDILSGADDTYYYKVMAVDYSGNTGPASNEVSLEVHAPEVIFEDHFDSDSDNGWTHAGANDKWERGIPNIPELQDAASPPNVWGTDLDSSYENNTDASLYSPVINLSDTQEATLVFNNWYSIETGFDTAKVEATRDGGATWNELVSFTGTNDGMKWTPVIYDLKDYTGSNMQIRFRLTTDSSVTFPGWYVDDFRILAASSPEGSTQGWKGEVKPESVKNLSTEPLFTRTTTDKTLFDLQVQSSGKTQSSAPSSADVQLKGSSGGIGIMSLPTRASVTVLETGRSVQTDPATGRYSLTHVAGEYNLKAEAYGYFPQTKPVTIGDGETAKVNFSLEPVPTGQVNGLVTDERTGEPIAGARVIALEDTKVAPVQTAEDGTFTLTLMEGTYSLLVQAGEYYSKTVTVTVTGNESVDALVSLKPFVGMEGELGYDDGTGENAWSFNAGGNAWGIRFTPESEAAMVTGARLTFWNELFPVPGGTAFQYAVYDASGKDGAPGNLLAGPFNGTALRDETQWTEVELPSPVTVEGDFYIVYIQPNPGSASPALATDEDTEASGRAWERISGVWAPSAIEGNFMVRAQVKYAVNAPVIVTPTTATYTNEADLTVTGTSTAEGSEITIYNEDTAAGTGVISDKAFSVPVTLHPGTNTLTAEAEVNGKTTDRSEPVVVTLDQTAPELTVNNPADGTVMNSEVVTVTGTASDENFDALLVNGQSVRINSDGSFTYKLIVEEGDNTITVTARDLAGNETTEVRTVHVRTALPELTNILPSEDVHIASGESVTVSFDSSPGLTAAFRIELPLSMSTFARGGVAMTETTPGHYEGTYTTPASLKLDGGVIVITAADAAGNETEAEAAGKLYVGGSGDNPGDPGNPDNPGNPGDPGEPTPPANLPPIAVIVAADQGAKKEKITFSAAGSQDTDGKIVKYEWDFGDGNTATKQSASHKFSQKGFYTVKLTVTDNKGAKATAEHVIEIK